MTRRLYRNVVALAEFVGLALAGLAASALALALLLGIPVGLLYLIVSVVRLAWMP